MLGIVVERIQNDHVSYIMFRELNKLADKVPCFVFTNGTVNLPMENKFTILQHVDAMSHKGTLIGTNLLTSQIVAKSMMPKKKFVYLWDLDWSRLSNFNANQLNNIYLNDDIEVITRSKKHQEVFSKMFRKTDKIIYNWRAEELLKVIQ